MRVLSFGGFWENVDVSPFDLQSLLLEELDCLRIGELFFREDSCCEGLRSVVFFHDASALEDDRAGVVGAVYEVDSAAADFAAVGENRFVDVLAEHSLPPKLGSRAGWMFIVFAENSAGTSSRQSQPARQTRSTSASWQRAKTCLLKRAQSSNCLRSTTKFMILASAARFSPPNSGREPMTSLICASS